MLTQLIHLESTSELEDKRKNFDIHLGTIQARKAKQIELREREEEALEDLRRKEGNLSRALGGLIARRDVSLLFEASRWRLPKLTI